MTTRGLDIKGHPEVAGHRRLVEAAVTRPTAIRFSTADADCRVYYGVGPRAGLMTAVVADVLDGYVKTAYLTRNAKGAIEW